MKKRIPLVQSASENSLPTEYDKANQSDRPSSTPDSMNTLTVDKPTVGDAGRVANAAQKTLQRIAQVAAATPLWTLVTLAQTDTSGKTHILKLALNTTEPIHSVQELQRHLTPEKLKEVGGRLWKGFGLSTAAAPFYVGLTSICKEEADSLMKQLTGKQQLNFTQTLITLSLAAIPATAALTAMEFPILCARVGIKNPVAELTKNPGLLLKGSHVTYLREVPFIAAILSGKQIEDHFGVADTWLSIVANFMTGAAAGVVTYIPDAMKTLIQTGRAKSTRDAWNQVLSRPMAKGTALRAAYIGTGVMVFNLAEPAAQKAWEMVQGARRYIQDFTVPENGLENPEERTRFEDRESGQNLPESQGSSEKKKTDDLPETSASQANSTQYIPRSWENPVCPFSGMPMHVDPDPATDQSRSTQEKLSKGLSENNSLVGTVTSFAKKMWEKISTLFEGPGASCDSKVPPAEVAEHTHFLLSGEEYSSGRNHYTNNTELPKKSPRDSTNSVRGTVQEQQSDTGCTEETECPQQPPMAQEDHLESIARACFDAGNLF